MFCLLHVTCMFTDASICTSGMLICTHIVNNLFIYLFIFEKRDHFQALCGVGCIDLMFNGIKILGVYYSYDKNLENQENFINLVLKIEKHLRLWRMQNLSVAGKITVFKTVAISNIVHLALVKVIPISAILDKIKKHFISKNGNRQIKQDSLCKDYENEDLKNVDITFKKFTMFLV